MKRAFNDRERAIVDAQVTREIAHLRAAGHKVNAASFAAGYYQGLTTNFSALQWRSRNCARCGEPFRKCRCAAGPKGPA
jgi:hypothetical protein